MFSSRDNFCSDFLGGFNLRRETKKKNLKKVSCKYFCAIQIMQRLPSEAAIFPAVEGTNSATKNESSTRKFNSPPA
jgi:hypothetical protein